MLPANASVVSLRACDPHAHCAQVVCAAPRSRSAAAIGGYTHNGAWAENLGHHASPSGSPQSAGFSTIQHAPAP
eukprot:4346870-Pleurochrysis_carterae.AAC.1